VTFVAIKKKGVQE